MKLRGSKEIFANSVVECCKLILTQPDEKSLRECVKGLMRFAEREQNQFKKPKRKSHETR